MKSNNYDHALEFFRDILSQSSSRIEMNEIIKSRDTVLSRYQPIFRHENIQEIGEAEFRSFLYFDNNRHWSGLFRHVTALTSNMSLLQNTLLLLTDPSQPLADRFDKALSQIKGLGKGLATAILLVSSPDKYGVWNNTSEEALRETGVWKEFVGGRTAGQRYEQINKLLGRLANDLEIDLWTLDALMWGILSQEEDDEVPITPPMVSEITQDTFTFFEDIYHPVMKDRLSRLSNAPLDTIVREAGVVFEDSLRSAGNLDHNSFGVRMVEEILKPGGILIFSSHYGEQEGVQQLFSGAMKFIRNPPMHKIVDYPESVARQYLRLIDALLMLLEEATFADDITVDDIRHMLRRIRIPQGQKDLYRILYTAGDKGITASELAKAMNRTPSQLSGVLGALGNRINKTEGLEEKGWIGIVLDISETKDGEWLYVMRPILRKALEAEGLVL